MTRTCKNCGDPFEVQPYGWKRQYCQRKCRPSVYYRNRCFNLKGIITAQCTCKVCGKMFSYVYMGAQLRSYCSDRCKYQSAPQVAYRKVRVRDYAKEWQAQKARMQEGLA